MEPLLLPGCVPDVWLSPEVYHGHSAEWNPTGECGVGTPGTRQLQEGTEAANTWPCGRAGKLPSALAVGDLTGGPLLLEQPSLQEAEKDTGVRNLRNVGQSFHQLSTSSVSVFLPPFLFPLCSLVLNIKGIFAHIHILGIKRPQRWGSSSIEIMDGTVIKGVRGGGIDSQAGALVCQVLCWSLGVGPHEPHHTWLPSVVKRLEGTQEPISL